jgi:hypothetical protein
VHSSYLNKHKLDVFLAYSNMKWFLTGFTQRKMPKRTGVFLVLSFARKLKCIATYGIDYSLVPVDPSSFGIQVTLASLKQS